MVETGEVRNYAEIAKNTGLTRARVCQITSLLRLAPEIQAYIDSLSDERGIYYLTERKLRELVKIKDMRVQLEKFHDFGATTLERSAESSS